MTAIATNNFRVSNAADFLTTLGNKNFYLFIGRSLPWTDENDPPLPLDNISTTEFDVWNTILAAKRIEPANSGHLVTRFDWETGTVYSQYDPDSGTYYDETFYVLTDDFNVYKCIDNNSGAASTNKPNALTSDIFSTADSYQWKYMYTISTSDALNFLTPQHMPVRNIVGNTDIDGPGLTPYPPGGHGASNIDELNANFIGLSVELAFDEGGKFPVDNDYRVVGLVDNPYLFGTTSPATGTAYRQLYQLNISGLSGEFEPDETITDGTNTGVVVQFNPGDVNIQVYMTNGVFATGTVTGSTSGAAASIDSVNSPELEPSSGKVLYVENRRKIQRASDQTESITIILEF